MGTETMKLYTTDAGFKKGVDAFTTSYAKINQTLHTLLCSAILLACRKDSDHPPGTGDNDYNSRVGYLLGEIPSGMRSVKVEKWIKRFAPVDIKADGTVKMASKKRRAEFHWDIKTMMETPFWELPENKPVETPWALRTALENLAKKAKKEGVTQDQFTAAVGEFIDQAGTIFMDMATVNRKAA